MLLEQITHGYLPDDNLRLLASRLPRINAKAEDSQRAEFLRIAGVTMSSISQNIYNALEGGLLPEFKSSNDPNQERKALGAPLANKPEARRYLLELNAGFVKTLLPGEDTLISSGFTLEEAEATTREFEEYLQQLRDSDEAVRIIAANSSEPITYEMLSDLAKKLAAYNYKFRFNTLWNDYHLLRPDAVVPLKDRKEREAMTCLIQLVRFAFKSIPRLRSLTSQAAQRFELWCGQTQRQFSSLSPRQKEILQQIASYVVSNGTCTRAVCYAEFLLKADGGELLLDGVGGGDKVGIARGGCLEVHVVAPDMMTGKLPCAFLGKDAQADAEFHVWEKPVKTVQSGKHAQEVRVRLLPAAPAGDIPEDAHAAVIDFPGCVNDRLLRQKRKGVDARIVMGALGAEPAVLAAFPAFRVDNGAAYRIRRRECTSHLVCK